MGGLKELAEAHKLKAAYIPVIIGGVDRAVIEVAKPSKESPVGVVAKKIELTGPIAICGAQGMICELENGGIEPHLHITFVDSNGHLHGGHLEAGTAPVTTTADGGPGSLRASPSSSRARRPMAARHPPRPQPHPQRVAEAQPPTPSRRSRIWGFAPRRQRAPSPKPSAIWASSPRQASSARP